jgi:flagellar basal-body rod modification protein FlgD
MNIQGLIPAITGPLQTGNANAVANAASTPSNSSTTGTGESATSLQDTFLNLLVTELQNQDPTAPVDPTAMVGQLVSLNQLDQLISINQTLSSLAPGTSSAGSATQAVSSSPFSALATNGTPNTSSSNPSSTAVSAALSQIQSANTNAASSAGLMNLYGNVAVPTQTSNSTLTGGR